MISVAVVVRFLCMKEIYAQKISNKSEKKEENVCRLDVGWSGWCCRTECEM